ncbi:MAG: hypothetical protein H7138_19965 [Myxococcales bacterium]|nr:hypothetical protein [Myxococcales bacterium]
MEQRSQVAGVRKRPGMYVGDTDDGSGLVHLVLEVVANAYDPYMLGRCSSIGLTIAADGTTTVDDDGPGIAVGGGNGVPPIDVMLTQLSTRPTVDGHRPHVHLGLGGLGLVVVNALSDRFELVTVRDGIEARTTYARGEVVEPLTTTPTERPSGTTIRFRPDPLIFRHARVPRVELTRTLEDLSFLAPRLRVRWSIEGDQVAARGLVGRVALGVPCSFEDVACHRGSYDTAQGPIDVEVALAWRFGANEPPMIDSFVNLARTRADGTHVKGLLDGVHAFLGAGRRPSNALGLVALVSVVLTDVLYGNPTKDRLDSPEARAPVREAVNTALEAWALTHAEQVDALRKRHKALTAP